MTVTNTDSSVTYTGNGSTTEWPFSFEVPDAASLNVELIKISDGTRTVLTSTDYTVTGLGEESGGTVTYPKSGSPLAATHTITIFREVELTQNTSVSNQTGYNAEVVEDVWDRLTMQVQDRKTVEERSFRVGPGHANLSELTPKAETVIGFDANKDITYYDREAVITVSETSKALFDSVSALEADTTMGYTEASSFPVAEGDIIWDGAYLHEVAASDAVDAHLTTVGGVKLYETGVDFTTLARFKDAVARGVTYAVGRVVWAGGVSYEYLGDGNTNISGLTGWKSHKPTLALAASPTLPIGELTLPATFNNTLGASIFWNGSAIEYVVPPYDLIDFEKEEGLSAVNQYYVNYSTGDNANTGTSSAAAWKTLDYAIANATSPAVINLEDDWIGYLSFGSTATYTGKLKIKGKSGRTRIAGMREDYDKASFSWTLTGSEACYKSSTASAKQYRSMFDGNYRNKYGIPRPLTAAADIATCEGTPGTFYWDSATSTLYVYMHNGRVPDPDDGWIYTTSPYDFEIQQGGASSGDVILLENLEFVSNNGATSAGAVVRYRPVTTGSPTGARFGMKNCLLYGGQDNGAEIYDADVIALEDCHAWYNRTDGLNYHSFVSTGTKGEYITVYEHNCTAFHNGWDGWDDQQSLSNSANGSTSHDSMHILRTNTVAGNCNGAVIADVNGVHSLNYNVSASQPDSGGTAGVKACFWHDSYSTAGTTNIMYLWGCSAHDDGDADVKLLTNQPQSAGDYDGEIRVKYWQGQTDGAVTGTIYDWSGAAL